LRELWLTVGAPAAIAVRSLRVGNVKLCLRSESKTLPNLAMHYTSDLLVIDLEIELG
jgi:hypothetical protein